MNNKIKFYSIIKILLYFIIFLILNGKKIISIK